MSWINLLPYRWAKALGNNEGDAGRKRSGPCWNILPAPYSQGGDKPVGAWGQGFALYLKTISPPVLILNCGQVLSSTEGLKQPWFHWESVLGLTARKERLVVSDWISKLRTWNVCHAWKYLDTSLWRLLIYTRSESKLQDSSKNKE